MVRSLSQQKPFLDRFLWQIALCFYGRLPRIIKRCSAFQREPSPGLLLLSIKELYHPDHTNTSVSFRVEPFCLCRNKKCGACSSVCHRLRFLQIEPVQIQVDSSLEYGDPAASVLFQNILSLQLADTVDSVSSGSRFAFTLPFFCC